MFFVLNVFRKKIVIFFRKKLVRLILRGLGWYSEFLVKVSTNFNFSMIFVFKWDTLAQNIYLKDPLLNII